MQTHEVVYELESCIRETAPPVDYVVKDKKGNVVFTARLEAPTWNELGNTQALIGSAPDFMRGALLVACVVKEWSLPDAVSADNVLRLHARLQEDLSTLTANIISITTGQLKNSEASSLHSGLEANSTEMES